RSYGEHSLLVERRENRIQGLAQGDSVRRAGGRAKRGAVGAGARRALGGREGERARRRTRVRHPRPGRVGTRHQVDQGRHAHSPQRLPSAEAEASVGGWLLAVDRWPKREGASANGQRPTANEKASYGLQLRPY